MNPLAQSITSRLSACYSQGEARALARILCCEVLGQSDVDFFVGKDTVLSDNERKKVEDIIQRLLLFEPIQYIQGEAPFMGERFKVNTDVLIPRPETAELVQLVVDEMKVCGTAQAALRLLDIGTGSGCIAVMLARLLPSAEVEAWDISSEALGIARENALRMGCQVDFKRRDVLTYTPSLEEMGRYAAVVSNPPYICLHEAQQMERNVLDWEPNLALFVPDDDPLRFYRCIASQSSTLLRPGGRLYFEINQAYGNEVVELLKGLKYSEVALLHDLQGNPRMVKAVCNRDHDNR
ncbi:MAG: peptide chain release factor N(5)-glutamine methyltransferase [Bacteroides sp.]